MYMFSAERLPLSAPARLQWVEPAGGGSGKRKAEDVWQKMHTLIYPDPLKTMN